MKKTTNNTHIEGYIYESKLEEKVSGQASKNPGTKFITGTLTIATDDEMLNVVSVHYTYVTQFTAKGNPNNTFNVLKSIIDGDLGTVVSDGKENADKIRIDSSIGLNEWFDSRNNNALISTKRNEGGFIHQMTVTEPLNSNPDARATFDVDMLITKANRMEADEERNQPERMTLKGFIFDFRNSLLPVDFTVLNPRAMDYFEGCGISESTPFFTRIQGRQISQTKITRVVESSAFGDDMIKETKTPYRLFEVTWATNDPYAWDDESTILATELQEKVAQRELYLADMRKRQEDYMASRNAINNAASPNKGGYDF